MNKEATTKREPGAHMEFMAPDNKIMSSMPHENRFAGPKPASAPQAKGGANE